LQNSATFPNKNFFITQPPICHALGTCGNMARLNVPQALVGKKSQIDEVFVEDATVIDRAPTTQGATSSALEDKPAEDQVDAATAAAIDSGLDETAKRDWLIAISFLFAAVAVTTAWMIGLVWGAIVLMRWLFS
jgi:hypothetical protein